MQYMLVRRKRPLLVLSMIFTPVKISTTHPSRNSWKLYDCSDWTVPVKLAISKKNLTQNTTMFIEIETSDKNAHAMVTLNVWTENIFVRQHRNPEPCSSRTQSAEDNMNKQHTVTVQNYPIEISRLEYYNHNRNDQVNKKSETNNLCRTATTEQFWQTWYLKAISRQGTQMGTESRKVSTIWAISMGLQQDNNAMP